MTLPTPKPFLFPVHSAFNMSKKPKNPTSKPLFARPGLALGLALAVGAIIGGVLYASASSSAPASASSAPSTTQTAPAAAAGPSLARIAAEAKGFNVGPTLRQNIAYVFFDAQCKYCAALWQSLKPLESQARFVWIPVGLLNRASTTQGAAILSAADPVAAMNEHEELFSGGRGGISASSNVSDALEADIRSNTALMQAMGGRSIPYVVARNAKTGQLVTRAGAAPTAEMASFLGLQPPSP